MGNESKSEGKKATILCPNHWRGDHDWKIEGVTNISHWPDFDSEGGIRLECQNCHQVIETPIRKAKKDPQFKEILKHF
jgi:hypothetical protein